MKVTSSESQDRGKKKTKQATYKEGVLRINLPKVAEKPGKIKVQVGK